MQKVTRVGSVCDFNTNQQNGIKFVDLFVMDQKFRSIVLPNPVLTSVLIVFSKPLAKKILTQAPPVPRALIPWIEQS
jgi:hypothetical protein